MDLPLKRVEEILYQRIPLAKALNCQIVESTNRGITLRVPKFVNTVQDHDFSEACAICLGKLAAWTFLDLALQRLDYKPWVTLSQAHWKKLRSLNPEATVLSAHCPLPDDKQWQQFLRMLSRKAEATVQLRSIISDDQGDVSTLTCEYIAQDLDPV